MSMIKIVLRRTQLHLRRKQLEDTLNLLSKVLEGTKAENHQTLTMTDEIVSIDCLKKFQKQ